MQLQITDYAVILTLPGLCEPYLFFLVWFGCFAVLSGVVSPGQVGRLSAQRSELPRLPVPEPASGPEPAGESSAAVHSHSESAPSLKPRKHISRGQFKSMKIEDLNSKT